jgi:magnesium-dependent phosphatase-1
MSEVQQLPISEFPQVIDQPVRTPLPQTDYEIAFAALNTPFNPSILVFDCDWTLYPYDCDKDRVAPFSRTPWGEIRDAYYRPSDPYNSVPAIFGAIADSGIPVAFLSRNSSSHQVRNLLSTIPCKAKTSLTPKTLWDTMPSHDYFHAYSSANTPGKTRHFTALKAITGVEFGSMLFFDDLPDNIKVAQRQGTTSVLLNNGLTLEAFLSGLEAWRSCDSRFQ